MDDEIKKEEMDPTRFHVVDLSTEMRKSYLDYAMSVIISRALPDVRDGLKPVHRRILYGMYDMGIKFNGPNKKCARIVGDVLGKYHPHGDASVYDALVRLGQDFSLRYPVVKAQGNFGSIDGDPPAAMRYTEAKISKIGEEMLTDIQKDTVDFVPNYDDSLTEPSVLPAAFPFLLVNGTSGIAVGMATNMPPHNLSEAVDGVCAVIDNPEITNLELMEYIQGPDFPSAGVICGKKGIVDAFTTGKGKIVVRGRFQIETHGKREQIVFSELPYQVNKAELVKKIDEYRKDDVIPGISQVRDESDKDGIRVVIELKEGAVDTIVLNSLFSKTALQSNFNVYNLALKDGKPVVLTLKDMLVGFIDHREQVVERRTRFDLKKAEERAHILLGLKAGLDQIDAVIETIKKSENNAVASIELQKLLNIDEIQAQAIIDMRLGRLSQLETSKLLEELAEIEKRISEYHEILSSRENVLAVVKKEILEIKADYGDRRKTLISEREVVGLTDRDFIKEEEVAVSISHRGYIKRLPVEEYKAQGRGGKGVKGARLVEDDFIEHFFTAQSHDIVMYITDMGRAFYTEVWQIPEAEKTSRGTNLRGFFTKMEKKENITSVICFRKSSWVLKDEDKIQKALEEEEKLAQDYLLMVTRQGITKKVKLNDFRNAKTNGVKAIILDEGDTLSQCIFVGDEDEVMYITKKGKGLRTKAANVRTMGRATHGVKAMNLANDDEIVGLVKVDDSKRILMVTENGKGKQVRFNEFMAHGRATAGQRIYNVDEKTSGIVNALAVDDSNDVVFITLKGQTIRVHVKDISIQGRNASGVKIVSFKKANDTLVAMAETAFQEEEEEDESVEATPTGATTSEESQPVSEEGKQAEPEQG